MNPIRIIPPEPQSEWGWGASLNFFLGGTGAGFYLACFFIGLRTPVHAAPDATVRAAVLAAVLMMTGLIGVGWEAGRPFRGYRAFRGVSHSWMSRELACFALFAVTAAATAGAPFPGVEAVLVAAAAGFMACQVMILHAAAAVASWRSPLLIVMMLFNALISGMGMVLTVDIGRVPIRYTATVLITLVAVHVAVWVGWICRGIPLPGFWPRSRRLRALVKIGIGRLLPFAALMVLTSFSKNAIDVHVNRGVWMLVGIALMMGSYFFIRWIIEEAGDKYPVSLG